MAVPSSPASADGSERKKMSRNDKMEAEMDRSVDQNNGEDQKQLDHSNGAGVGVVGGRICEPQSAKTCCHQCRQKVVVFAAGCKNMKKDKQCTMKFCYKCLRNRYGEIAKEMEALDDWKCPKCRGICNCSLCMKKRGLRPTGMLIHAAKATGFSSVSELLVAKGPEACQEFFVKNKTATSAEEPISSQKQGKEGIREGAELSGDNGITGVGIIPTKENQKKKAKIKPRKVDASIDIHAVNVVLPPGTIVTSVSGIDLLPEDAGYALQFLEFCSTFEEVLEIRKGQPESVLRDIVSEHGRRKGKYSSAAQFLIQLLSFILKEEKESLSLSPDSDKDSWISPLKKCLSESDYALDDIPKDCFDKGYDGYEMLEPSQKLKLLIFLCDETLCTMEMRNWIEDQNSKFGEKMKEARENLIAAKEKERLVNLKLQDEVAKEVNENNGDLLTHSERVYVVSEIKAEAEQAHTETLKAIDSLPKREQRSGALRIQPILLDDKGRVYWRLKCFSDSGLLYQDIGHLPCEPESSERWFCYDAEETKVMEKHMLRLKRRKVDKLFDPLKMQNNNSDHEADSSFNEESTPTVNN